MVSGKAKKGEKILLKKKSMEMQANLLREVVESIAGKPAVEIVDLLLNKRNVNEFVIAKKLNLTINQARNILYKLANQGLVSSDRKKDERKGWYIYYWTLEAGKALNFLDTALSKEIEKLKREIEERKKTQHYICRFCNVELSQEEALAQSFICTECGQVFELQDNSAAINTATARMNKLGEHLAMIRQELAKVQEEHARKFQKQIKKQEEEKKAKRAAKRKQAKRAKVHLQKKKKPKKKLKKQKPKKKIKKKK